MLGLPKSRHLTLATPQKRPQFLRCNVLFAFHSDSRCKDKSSTLSPELNSFGLGFGAEGFGVRIWFPRTRAPNARIRELPWMEEI